MTTQRGSTLPHIDYLAMLLMLMSIALSRVLSEQSSTRCDEDLRTIACPLPCYCRAPDHRSVRCDAGGLTSVPSSVWTVVPISLNFSYNSIAEWTGIDVTSADNDHVACLRTLILSHSGVRRVRQRAFERLQGLRQLMLDYNHISTLDSTSFVGLRRLELLDISHNELVALPQSLFDQLIQLKVLRLAANRLSSVPVTVLRSVTQLNTLDFSDNPLTELQRDLFASTHQLVSLNVSGTRLARLVPGTTHHVANTLTVLDTSRCSQMTAAPDATDIAALTRLRRLTLPARTCRCDVINFRSVVDDVRSRKRPRTSLFCDNAAVDVNSICSDSLLSSSSVQPANTKPLPAPRDAKHDDPLPYNPMLGWYTAAVLSGLLFAFIACVGLEKAEKHLLDKCMSRNADKKHFQHLGGSTQQHLQQHGSASICTVADFGVDSYFDAETTPT